MATARAIANGNWSATGTWNGGVVPGNGDTVYSNGFTVTLDVPVTIGGANNPTVNTGSLVSGQWYEIVNVGGQNWTTIGAGSNTVGTVFLATGAGTAGNGGTAKALGTLSTLTNTAAGAITGGGGFTISTAVDCNADLRAGTTTCLTISAASGTVNLNNIKTFGGSVASAHGINNTNSANVNISGVMTGGSIVNAAALNNASSGIVNVNSASSINALTGQAILQAGSGGIVISASSTLSSTASHPIQASNGYVSISAPCSITAATSTNGVGIRMTSVATLTVSAACAFNASSGTGAALNIEGSGNIVISGSTFTASSTAVSVLITGSSDVRLSGNFIDHWSGFKSVNGSKWRLGVVPVGHITRYATDGAANNYFTAYSADYPAFGNPGVNNVRSGTVYGPSNELTGTCAVPAAGSVALGVAVDNTTGMAILTAANVQTALTSQGLTTTRAGYLDNISTAPPSAATIAAAVWAALTSGLSTVGSVGKLLVDQLDAAISTRSSYAGSDTSGVTTLLSRLTSGRAGNLDNLDALVSSRLASSGYTTPPTVTQVRQELDSNSTKLANLDATVSSRLASSSYSAPLDAAGTRNAVGLATGNLDTQLSGLSSGISGLPSASAIASAVWAAATRTLTTAIDNSSTIAAAVWAYASGRTVTGGTVDTLTNAPSVPSAATIASQVRTELSTELSRIDATVSSRLAPSGTLARVTLVDTTTTVTNSSPVDAGEIADAVRTELAPELAHLDADVSSRQATLARLQNVATTQEVGDIVEGALGD